MVTPKSKLPEAIFYSACIIAQTSQEVSNTITIINLYDKFVDNEYYKDFDLITTAIAIARGALIMDLIFKNYEEKCK